MARYSGVRNAPNINEKEDGGSEMGKSRDTLHLNGVHLFQGVIETVQVSLGVSKSRDYRIGG